jgi:ribosomal protein L25 (general stress protein Ctc)
MILKTVKYTDIKSTAIKEIDINGKSLIIVFSSSDKQYSYTINDSNFVELLDKTIKQGESVGKLVNSSLKEKNIELIPTDSK